MRRRERFFFFLRCYQIYVGGLELGFRVRQRHLVRHVFISTSYLFHVFETPSPLLSSECRRPECQQESWRPECLHPDRKRGDATVRKIYITSQQGETSLKSKTLLWSHVESNYSGAIKSLDTSVLHLNCIKARV